MQLKLPIRPAKTAREYVRERLADFSLRQAERDRKRIERRFRSIAPPAREPIPQGKLFGP
jgi:hypothetical protein